MSNCLCNVCRKEMGRNSIMRVRLFINFFFSTMICSLIVYLPIDRNACSNNSSHINKSVPSYLSSLNLDQSRQRQKIS